MKDLQDILLYINSNFEKNKKILCKEYGTLHYKDPDGNSLYHLIITCHTGSSMKSYAIETLLRNDINLNHKNKDGDTFIHYALKNNVDIRDITFILKDAMNYGFDINATNNCDYTILHNAILFIKKQEDLLKFTYTLSTLGFDFNVVDSMGANLHAFINEQEHLSEVTKSNLKRMIAADNNSFTNIFDNSRRDERKTSMKYGSILNYKKYEFEPALGREKEVNKLIISLATDKKLPLLVGPSGVGKTTIIDELVYQIKNDNVPSFLKDKTIYEVHMSSLLAGTKYRGDFENNMKEVMEYAIKNNAVLFIDEFHMVFGAGASEHDKSDAASILKTYIDRYGLKVIGATTDFEYEEYMSQDALKRRFDVIRVKELDKVRLADIAINTFDNLSQKRRINLSEYFSDNIDTIIDILLELTKDNNRKYDDKIYNPDLLISIIERAFAYSLVEDDYEFDIKHLILSIEDTERLYDYAKEVAIHNLNNMGINNNLVKNKIIDFNEYRKEHVLV